MTLIPKGQTIADVSNHRSHEWEKLEKILLTVSGGTLAASATLITSTGYKFSHTTILGFSWTLLSLSLIALLVSYAFVEWMDRNLLRKLKDDPNSGIPVDFIEKNRNKIAFYGADISNYFSLGTGIFGLLFLALFAFFNIQ